MDLTVTLQRILTDPTPADLWSLPGDLVTVDANRHDAGQFGRFERGPSSVSRRLTGSEPSTICRRQVICRHEQGTGRGHA